MAIKGIFQSDMGAQNDRVGEFSKVVAKLMPTGDAPMLALSSGIRREKIYDTTIHWMEENYYDRRIKVLADADNECGQIALDDASMVVQGQIYLVECTGEQFHVQGVAGNMISVRRGHGQTPMFKIPAGSYIVVVGSAFEEGSEAPNATRNIPYSRFNFTQIFRNSYGVTRTTQKTKYYSTNDPFMKDKRKALAMHAKDIEMASIWGHRDLGYQNQAPIRFADGFNAQIQTNIFTSPTTGIRLQHLDAFIMRIFDWNIEGQPNERIAFCGNSTLAVLNELVRINSDYNIHVNETQFGINVRKYITPFGMLTFVVHPMMNANPTFRQELYVYHPAALRYAWLTETMVDDYNKMGTRAGVDADKGVVTSEVTFKYMLEKTGGLFYGICRPDYSVNARPILEDPCCPSDVETCCP